MAGRTQVLGQPVEKDHFTSSDSASSRLNRSSRMRRSARQSLGAGYISLPPLPSMDPLSKLIENPSVDGLAPRLQPGMVVAEQYEIKGAIAHGGVGWIYLAWDQILSRWVVLKGLLHADDEESIGLVLAERQFLAAVKHPNIVSVYNFVRSGPDGFIVMEYIGGKTLKTIRTERGPLPVAEAIAYIYSALHALSYLHRQGMLFCDFKPDNCMLEEDDVKLIDMGCVRRLDDKASSVYGTIGYSSPDAAETPSISSDLYTVGRSLAILVSGFDLFGEYVEKLPGPDAVSVFAQHAALYAFLKKATHPDPDKRFQSADIMAGQLLGVLREVTAGTAPPRSFESAYFLPVDQFNAAGAGSVEPAEPHMFLPRVRPDMADSAVAALLTVSGLSGDARIEALQQTMEKFKDSIDTPIRIAEISLDRGEYARVEPLLAIATERDALDWRAPWMRGKLALAGKGPAGAADAIVAFEWVAAELPGELAPRFALGIAAEAAGDPTTAAKWFEVVSRVDPAHVVASLGYARCLQQLNDADGALDAYRRVPASSNAYPFAQLQMARAIIESPTKPPRAAELTLASRIVEALPIEGRTLHEIRSQLFIAAIDAIRAGRVEQNPGTALLGIPLQLRQIRFGAEAALRSLARVTESAHDRVGLIQRANALRPMSWI
jgi:serine/threonine-protein kinase PknG